MVHSYGVFCADVRPATRQRVLVAAKELNKLMTNAPKKAEAGAGGFPAASPSTRRAAAGGTTTLNDINNNIRLLVDAVRRGVEVSAVSVRTLFVYETHA